MTDIVLGGITLNPSLQWINKEQYTPVVQEIKETLGGSIVVYAKVLGKGRPIILEATDEEGWFTYQMVTSLQALANDPDGTYTLNFHGTNYTVMFDNSQGSSLEFTKLQPRAVSLNTDYYSGVIKLFTV